MVLNFCHVKKIFIYMRPLGSETKDPNFVKIMSTYHVRQQLL